MGVVMSKLLRKLRSSPDRVRESRPAKMTDQKELPMDEPPHWDRLLQLDDYLAPYKQEFFCRYKEFRISLDLIEKLRELGINVNKADNSGVCLEWAPGADDLSLVDDFNNWDVNAHKYEKLEFGKWRLVVPAKDGQCPIPHNSIIKIVVRKDGQDQYKLSPWANSGTRPSTSGTRSRPPRPPKPEGLRIYEAHVGISSLEGRVNTYRNFATDLPDFDRPWDSRLFNYNRIMMCSFRPSVPLVDREVPIRRLPLRRGAHSPPAGSSRCRP
ncbi:CBM-48 domain-containing protein [Aphelenchoides fujianensis]|nr:CBM-48 domain-containing protein [Aphelenchoides fujianensis]